MNGVGVRLIVMLVFLSCVCMCLVSGVNFMLLIG